MTPVHNLNPESCDLPAGKYSHLSIISENARIATFAGQIATTTGPDMPDNASDQARLVFAAIEALLASQGAAPTDLIRLLTLIVGRDNLTGFNTVRDEIYAGWFPDGAYPVSTLAIVAGLAAESILVEIEGSFMCPPVTSESAPLPTN